MPVREFFHLIHVVDDIGSANERFAALFGGELFSENWSDLDHRWASFTMLGDMMLELIQPRHSPEDEHFPLTKFHTRFGQHLHSLSWYVDIDDMAQLFKAFRSEGVRVAKPGGGLFPEDTEDPGTTMFTHAKDTAGQLEFVGVQGGPLGMDPRGTPEWKMPPPESSPLTLVGTSHFTTSTRDLAALRTLYERVLELRCSGRRPIGLSSGSEPSPSSSSRRPGEATRCSGAMLQRMASSPTPLPSASWTSMWPNDMPTRSAFVPTIAAMRPSSSSPRTSLARSSPSPIWSFLLTVRSPISRLSRPDDTDERTTNKSVALEGEQ